MTPDEKHQQMTTRNEAICAYYQGGKKLSECASRFKLGRQRILQILQHAGVWKPYTRNNRKEFLGVTVSEDTKAALKVRADAEGISVSQLTSDVLDEALAKDVR